MKILPVICCISVVFLLSCSSEVTESPVEKEVKKSKKPAEKYILSTENYQKPVKTAENDEKSVVLQGKALYDNGSVVPEFVVSAIPRGENEKSGIKGHIKNLAILTEPDGNFEIPGFQEAFYTMDLMCIDAIPIQTNLQIIADESVLDLEFKKAPSVSGMVVLAESGEPVPDVTVYFTSQSLSLPPVTVITDNNGKFSLLVPISRKLHGYLEVTESEFAPVKIYLRPSELKDTYVITLRKTGIITGRVINQLDKPVKGVLVEARPRKMIERKTNIVNRALTQEEWEVQNQIRGWYQVRSETPSDALGQFVISNAAAPAVQGIQIEWLDNLNYNPGDRVYATVTPGKTTAVELKVFEKPCLLLKVRDSKGTPVLDYNLAIRERTEHWSSSSTPHIILSSDRWERITMNIMENTDRMNINLAVSALTGGRAETNNLACLVGSTNFVTLILDDSTPVTIAGTLMNSDNIPITDTIISIYYSKGYLSAKTDHTGNFFIENIYADTNSMMSLKCVYNTVDCKTNVNSNNEFIEWKLPEISVIKGRVCIESEETPVKNFILRFEWNNGYTGLNTGNKIKTTNGFFSQPIKFTGTKTLFIIVDGYAPVTKQVTAKKGSDIDIGTIIMQTKPGIVTGRVIDEKRKPYKTDILLKSGDSNIVETARNSKNSGRYTFKNIAPSNYYVCTYTSSGPLQSEEFILSEGKIVEVPDLVVITTNRPLVTFLFLLPDGTPAANARVKFSYLERSYKTDEAGSFMGRLNIGTYDKCPVKQEGKEYYSELFEITEETEILTILLHEMNPISGNAFLDREPIDGKSLLFYYGRHEYRAMARKGAFSVNAPPGDYVVKCKGLNSSARTTLNVGNNNTVELFSGTSSCKILLACKGNYRCTLYRDFNGKLGSVYSQHIFIKDDPVIHISNLIEGNYIFRAKSGYNNTTTNIDLKIELHKNENKVIQIP
jgi:hypothetical protein